MANSAMSSHGGATELIPLTADTDLIQFRTLANQINIGEQHLRQLLQKHGWIYDTPSERWSNKKQQKVIEHRWRCKADKKRYFHLVPNHTAPRINGEVRQTLKITPVGIAPIGAIFMEPCLQKSLMVFAVNNALLLELVSCRIEENNSRPRYSQ